MRPFGNSRRRPTIRDVLGRFATDRVSGLTGVVTAVTVQLDGTTRLEITPRAAGNGHVQAPRWFDARRLHRHGTLNPAAPAGGPHQRRGRTDAHGAPGGGGRHVQCVIPRPRVDGEDQGPTPEAGGGMTTRPADSVPGVATRVRQAARLGVGLAVLGFVLWAAVDAWHLPVVSKRWPGGACVRVEPSPWTCDALPERYSVTWIGPETGR